MQIAVKLQITLKKWQKKQLKKLTTENNHTLIIYVTNWMVVSNETF